MNIFNQTEKLLESFAHQIPLELFTFLGSLLEEVIAPIPSPIVMTLSGSLAALQGKPLLFLLLLSLSGALGKTLGAGIVYTLSDKAEDIVIGKFGKLIGVSHQEVEKIGKHLKGNSHDYLLLILARSAPFMSSTVVSVGCGVLKVNLKLFLISTFVGTVIRDGVYLYFGFVGLAAFESILVGFDKIETLIQILAVLLVGSTLVYLYYRRGKGNLVDQIMRFFKK